MNPVNVLVEQLQGLPAAAFDEVSGIEQLLRRTPVEPASLEKYLQWDAQHYTRNLIHKTALYELMAICWEVGQASSIHNHREQNCWMMVPIGRLLVENYRVLQQDLEAGTCRLESTGVVEMNSGNPLAVNPREPVHKVVNPANFAQRAVSLHLYSRPFSSCVAYSLEEGRCGEIALHYNSEYGVKTSSARSQA